jgi:hypothetical protein
MEKIDHKQRKKISVGSKSKRSGGANSKVKNSRELDDSSLFLAGSAPVLLEGETTGYLLSGNEDGEISMQEVVESYISTLPGPLTGYCVAASLKCFTNACKSIGIITRTLYSHTDDPTKREEYEIPLVEYLNDHNLLRRFLSLWYSSVQSSWWLDFDKEYRGAGAPGALLYAGLAENGQLIRHSGSASRGSWPDGLKPGAFLQLWPNEREFVSLRDDREQVFGHSCVFREYKSSKKIQIVDQSNHKRVIEWGGPFGKKLYYVIAANPGKADKVPKYDEDDHF